MTDDVFHFGSPTADLGAETVLDRLRARIAEKVQRPDIFIEVPDRPGVKLRVSPNITSAQIKAWRRNAGENNKNGMDQLTFAAYVVAGTTKGILFEDEEAFMEDGVTSITFASPEIWRDTLNVSRPVPEGVRAFFGVDPHIEAAAVAIMERAGFGEEVTADDDPLETSSTN